MLFIDSLILQALELHPRRIQSDNASDIIQRIGQLYHCELQFILFVWRSNFQGFSQGMETLNRSET